MNNQKEAVLKFWDEASCGEELYLKGRDEQEQFSNQMKIRYELEPFIEAFAGFKESRKKKVLEIGVGLGADHQRFAENGAILYGCDLSARAVEKTRRRFNLLGLHSNLQVADTENLPYQSATFDLVYSYGVIHHTPNTEKALLEIHRVLKPGGKARIMIYNKYSMLGFMLWTRYGLFRLRPFTSLYNVYDKYMESPGTKAYTTEEAKEMCKDFSEVNIEVKLSHADLLNSDAGQRHRGMILTIAKKLYPRTLVKTLFKSNGLFMLISLTK